ncbi:protein scribble homolog isoform X3 [Clavelina lepadiformis]|uniref:protein scribble homolog isoform X3 n=1 Tax=Clavelina lepadiformis TaxID=159417 RepID=UPI004040F0A5
MPGIWKCFPTFRCNRQVDSIDKRHSNLVAVPEDLLRYSRTLEEVLLDSNQISDLPKQFFKLVKLRKIGLSDNELQQLSSEIAQLVCLVDFDISRNDLAEIPENIKFCTALEVVDLSGNPLTKLPEGICQLHNLRHLNVNDVSLIRLPQDIGKLSKLQTLECRENLLQAVPFTLCSNGMLEQLDLGANELEELPNTIDDLNNLHELWLDGNHLTSLPETIGNLKKLVCLDLSENKLDRIPDSIGQLQSITDLTLSHNFIEELPDTVGNLSRLSILKVDQNRLNRLTPFIGNCVNITELMLTENLLTELPETCGDLRKITTLNIDRNQLEHLPSQLGCCENLNILSVRDNMLKDLPSDLSKAQNLRVLDVSGNRLDHLPISLASLNLKALWLSENQSQPLLKFQTEDRAVVGEVLTCFLLPQQPSQSMVNLLNGSVATQEDLSSVGRQQKRITFHEDQLPDIDDEGQGLLQRHLTPHPKELKRQQQSEVLQKHRKLAQNAHEAAKFAGNESKNKSKKDNEDLLLLNSNNDMQTVSEDSPSADNNIKRDQAIFDENSPTYIDDESGDEYEEKEVRFNDIGDHDEVEGTTRSDRLQRKDTPHYKRDMKITETSKPDSVMALLRNQSLREPRDGGHSPATELFLDQLELIIQRDGGGLGLSIAGGKGSTPFVEEDDGIFISRVTPNGAAHHAGVRVGDKLLAVNDTVLAEVEHGVAVDALKSSNDIVYLLVERWSRRVIESDADIVPSEAEDEKNSENCNKQIISNISINPEMKKNTVSFAPEPQLNIDGKTFTAILKRSENLGFSIAGGIGSTGFRPGDCGIYVSKVVEGGQASSTGMQVDDKILSINASDVTNFKHEEAVSLLKQFNTDTDVVLVLYREDIYYTQPVTDLSASLASTIDMDSNNTNSNNAVLLVDSSLPLAKEKSPIVTGVEEFPVEEIFLDKGPGQLGLSIVGGTDHSSHPFGDGKSGIYVSKIQCDGAAAHSNLKVGDKILKVNDYNLENATHTEGANALLSSGPDMRISVRHDPPPADMKEVVLTRYPGEKLGISIRGGVKGHAGNPNDDTDEGIFISKINPVGAANRDGQLKVGQRIIEVNNQSLLSCTHAEAVRTLRSIGDQATFLLCHGYNLNDTVEQSVVRASPSPTMQVQSDIFANPVAAEIQPNISSSQENFTNKATEKSMQCDLKKTQSQTSGIVPVKSMLKEVSHSSMFENEVNICRGDDNDEEIQEITANISPKYRGLTDDNWDNEPLDLKVQLGTGAMANLAFEPTSYRHVSGVPTRSGITVKEDNNTGDNHPEPRRRQRSRQAIKSNDTNQSLTLPVGNTGSVHATDQQLLPPVAPRPKERYMKLPTLPPKSFVTKELKPESRISSPKEVENFDYPCLVALPEKKYLELLESPTTKFNPNAFHLNASEELQRSQSFISVKQRAALFKKQDDSLSYLLPRLLAKNYLTQQHSTPVLSNHKLPVADFYEQVKPEETSINHERLSFRDRRKYFEQEINQQSMKEKVVDDTSKGSIRSRKKINLVSDQDLKTIKQEEEKKYGTLSREDIRKSLDISGDDEDVVEEMSNVPADLDGHSTVFIEGTEYRVEKKTKLSARERLNPNYSISTSVSSEEDLIRSLELDVERAGHVMEEDCNTYEKTITPAELNRDHNRLQNLSPAERRALEAEKRKQWRQARFKSLEADALQAQMMLQQRGKKGDNINASSPAEAHMFN